MKTVLTIAGSDCSGGAGIQADLKTITVHKMYGMSVITALTAQNTKQVSDIAVSAPEFVEKQLEAVFSDIYPDAVKIGMIASEEIVEVIVKMLTKYQAKNVVLDPVMIATSGRQLMSSQAVSILKSKLFPITHMITPNIPEAQCLSGIKIQTTEDMILAARQIASFYQGHILIKGGHLTGEADDLLYSKGQSTWFKGRKIGNRERHGTGCTLSSAIACHLANNLSTKDSITNAKKYIEGALKDNVFLGSGSSPLNHAYNISEINDG